MDTNEHVVRRTRRNPWTLEEESNLVKAWVETTEHPLFGNFKSILLIYNFLVWFYFKSFGLGYMVS